MGEGGTYEMRGDYGLPCFALPAFLQPVGCAASGTYGISGSRSLQI